MHPYLKQSMAIRFGSEYSMCFAPSSKDLSELERWLKIEHDETGEGFLCNWNVISEAFDANEMTLLKFQNAAIGFVTWTKNTDLALTLEIVALHPHKRGLGLGRFFIESIIEEFKNNGIFVFNLQASLATSIPFWKKLGFRTYPNNMQSFYSDKYYLPFTFGNTQLAGDEIIELWESQPGEYPNKICDHKWIIDRTSRNLSQAPAVIFPVDSDWRLRWSVSGQLVFDDKIKYHKPEIIVSHFMIIA